MSCISKSNLELEESGPNSPAVNSTTVAVRQTQSFGSVSKVVLTSVNLILMPWRVIILQFPFIYTQ